MEMGNFVSEMKILLLQHTLRFLLIVLTMISKVKNGKRK